MKKPIAFLLALALVALAPGLEPYRLLAQTIKAPRTGAARPPGMPFSPKGPAGTEIRLNPMPLRLQTALPGGSGPNSKPKIRAPLFIESFHAPSLAPIIEAGLPAEENKDLEVSAAEPHPSGVAAMSEDLTPELEALEKDENAGGEATNGIGRRILNIILGRKGIAAGGGVEAGPSSPVLSGLGKASPNRSDAEKAAGESGFQRESILQDLRDNPPAAFISDYDGTLADRGPGGISLPAPDEVIEGLNELLRRGMPVGIISGRSLDYQPKGADIPMNLWEPLIARISPELRANLFFVGRVGGELALFDSKGEPIPYLRSDWSADEKAAIEESVTKALAANGVSRADIKTIEVWGQTNLVFKEGDGLLAAKFARDLSEEFRNRGLLYPVLYNGKNWAYFSKFDKGEGLRMMFTAMKAKGFPVTTSNLLFQGDEFLYEPGKPAGGDTAAALEFPKSRVISLGEAEHARLPPNTRALGVKGSRGAVLVINAILEGLSPKPKVEPEIQAAKDGFFSGKRGRVLRWALIAGGLAALPFLWTHVAAAAMAGTVMLTVIGIPQIVKNFREGPKATKDLALDGYLIWFAAAVLLTAASLLRDANGWWVASNIAGVAESLLVILQINSHRNDPALMKKTFKAVAVLGLALTPLMFGLLLGTGAWASAAFAAAMGFLLVLNWPQIKQNYLAYRRSGTAPAGLAWGYPALVAGGSALSLIPALAAGDVFWMLNSLAGILTTLIVLGQIFLPKHANGLLGRVIPAILKAEKAIGAWKDRILRRDRRDHTAGAALGPMPSFA